MYISNERQLDLNLTILDISNERQLDLNLTILDISNERQLDLNLTLIKSQTVNLKKKKKKNYFEIRKITFNCFSFFIFSKMIHRKILKSILTMLEAIGLEYIQNIK